MKNVPALALICSALCFVAPVSAQPIDSKTFVGPDRAVSDAEFGVAFTGPAGWQLQRGTRFGDQETTLTFTDATVPEASLSVYYRVFAVPFAPAEGIAASLRADAERMAKERANAEGGYATSPEGIVEKTISECAAVSWIGTYTFGNQKRIEARTHLANAQSRVHVFLNAPAAKLTELSPAYDALVASLHLTTATLAQTIDPHIVEARRLYLAKSYRPSADAFAAAFKSGTSKPNDLVVAAGAAARAGDRALALQWLQQAVAIGANNGLRIPGNADFASLRDSAEWTQLVAKLPGAAPAPGAVKDKPLQQTLLAILDEDQKYRIQLGDVEKKFGRDSDEIKALWKTIEEKDAANLGKVKAILDERGWVGADEIGPQAASALFLAIQHSDHATQERYLPMMREAVKAGKARGSNLALLEDRVALGEGKRQIYGSQIGRDPATGQYYVQRLDDPEHVDERRAAVGLQPLADYVKNWKLTWDVEAYKKQLAQLEAVAPKN